LRLLRIAPANADDSEHDAEHSGNLPFHHRTPSVADLNIVLDEYPLAGGFWRLRAAITRTRTLRTAGQRSADSRGSRTSINALSRQTLSLGSQRPQMA
jgi:hypothetical protein